MGADRSGDILRHGVIDRILRNDPRRGVDLRIGIDELKTVVRRDIEYLLNTRRTLDEEAGRYAEIPTSVLGYGIPDFTQFTGASSGDRRRIGKAIEDALRAFEPRLLPQSIRVDFVETEGLIDADMHFRIQGILHVEPIREAVSFDTAVDVDSGAVQIAAADV